jgi:thioredoxin reductase
MSAQTKKALEDKVREIQLRRLRQMDSLVRKGNHEVPNKKKSKPLGYKMQNTFAKNLQGLPGGTRIQAISERMMVDAANTGCKVRKEGIGVLRSARNANTTQGSQNRSIVTDETGRVVSDRQGRKGFGL